MWQTGGTFKRKKVDTFLIQNGMCTFFLLLLKEKEKLQGEGAVSF